MIKNKSDIAIEMVARRFDQPVEVVVAEIEKAIEEAMQNPDPAVRQRWKEMLWKGRKPTAAEFIEYISAAFQSP